MTWTKLHDLCGKGSAGPFHNMTILKQCLAHPEEVAFVDDRGYTPLHVAVACDNPSQDVIRALLQANRNAVMKKDLHGSTPLHLALCPDANPPIIKMLIDACPEIVSEKDKEGLMAIHVACRYCPCNEEVIRMLVVANPSGLHSRTKMGNLAKKKNDMSPSLYPHSQHLVLDGATSPAWKESQIKSTAQHCFEERSQQIRDGSYPLHMAIANGAPRHVLEILAKEAPEVAAKADKFGQTCLHLVLKYGVHDTCVDGADNNPTSILDMFKVVHSFNASQVKAMDRANCLPLHMACKVGCSIDVAKFLVNAYPDSVNIKNEDGNSPLKVAIASGHCSKELIAFLTESDEIDVEVPQ